MASMASMASTTPSTHYFFKNHKKPCKVSIPSRTIIVSQSHEEQPHKPSTDQVGRRYTLSRLFFSHPQEHKHRQKNKISYMKQFCIYILKGNCTKEQRISSCWSHLQPRVHFF